MLYDDKTFGRGRLTDTTMLIKYNSTTVVQLGQKKEIYLE